MMITYLTGGSSLLFTTIVCTKKCVESVLAEKDVITLTVLILSQLNLFQRVLKCIHSFIL